MPYGETLMELSDRLYNNPYQYNGKELDSQTGYYYYGARYYDPQRSFWLSVDPLVEVTMSPYAYTWNDPVNYADPTGMMGERIGEPGGPNTNKTYDGGVIEEVIIKARRRTKESSRNDPPGNMLSRFRERTSNWVQRTIREPVSNWLDNNTRNIFTLDAAGQARMDDLRSQTSAYMRNTVGDGIRWGAEHGLIGSGMGTGHVGAFEINVDLMGGKYSRLKNYINFDIEAEKGIKDVVSNFGKYFSKGSVDNIVANNPQATFLNEVYSSLAKGGRITVRGTITNKYFKAIWNGKADGLEGYRILKRVENVSKSGMFQSDGITPIKGNVNQIILQKRW